jgi:hypothetical protein
MIKYLIKLWLVLTAGVWIAVCVALGLIVLDSTQLLPSTGNVIVDTGVVLTISLPILIGIALVIGGALDE